MSSFSSQEGKVNALLVQGLKLADAGRVESALKLWQQALTLEPNSSAVRLLIYLAETYIETLSTGLDLSIPDFRSHLSEIGVTLDESLLSTERPSSVRVPGLPRPDAVEDVRGGTIMPGDSRGAREPQLGDVDYQAERNRQALSATSGAHFAVPEPLHDIELDEDDGGDVKRTMYGMPLRQTGESDGFELDEWSDAYGVPDPNPAPGAPSSSGIPRYSAEPPPPATHRIMSQRIEAPPPEATPSSAPSTQKVTAERSSRVSEPTGDPWADLSSELDAEDFEGSPRSGAWQRDYSRSEPAQTPPQTPAHGLFKQGSFARERAESGRRIGASSPETTGSIIPRDDPFAILDNETESAWASNRASSARTARRELGLRQGAQDQMAATKERDLPRQTLYGAPASAESDKPVTTSRPPGKEEHLPPPIYDSFEDDDFDLDSFLGEPAKPRPPDSARGSSLQDEIETPASGVPALERSFPEPRSAQVEDYTGLSTRATSSPPPDRPAGPLSESESMMLEELTEQDFTEASKSVKKELSGSEKLLEEIITLNPDDIKARRLLEKTRVQREKIHMALLGSVEATPRLMLGSDQLVWQNLDAKRGFVLSRVDGHVTIEDIIDIVNLPRHETIQILAEMVEEGILAIG